MTHMADIGIFGGSGFYEFLPDVEEVWIETPYGPPSDQIALATIDGKRVAFLPRHGKDHRFPPHKINYRANLWAMRELGVTRLIGPCAAGSLQAQIKPGDFVVTDQFVNRTWGREDTFFDGPITTHISAADPYCEELRQIAVSEGKKLGIPYEQPTALKKSPSRRKRIYIIQLRLSSLQCPKTLAGIGTLRKAPVAGFHRASPSTSLDKSKNLTHLQFLLLDQV